MPGRVGGVRSEAFFTYPPTLHNLLAEEGRPYPPTLSPDDVHPTPKPNRKIGAEEINHTYSVVCAKLHVCRKYFKDFFLSLPAATLILQRKYHAAVHFNMHALNLL